MNQKLGIYGLCLLLCLLVLINGRSLTAEQITLYPPPHFPEKRETAVNLQPQAVVGANISYYLPFVVRAEEIGQWVDTQDRQEVVNFYLGDYLASEGVPTGWTGSVGSCVPGSTTVAFKEAMLRRLNYFRAMAGIPALEGFLADYNTKAQAAALMMSAEGALSHSPGTDWACYTAAGSQGAGSSNLYLGVYGPAAISGYINDPGSGNYFVGHRRWILYPQSKNLGTGDIPSSPGYSPANALWVFDTANMWGSRPDTREAFIAWPPPGFVPYQVVYPRWSFAYDDADLTGASVLMSKNGVPLGLTISPVVNGYGENTLVWEPNDNFGSAPSADAVYQVTVSNVIVNGTPKSFNYTVTIINPGP
jgi:hypothetical protein